MAQNNDEREYVSPPKQETAEELLGWQIQTYQHLVQMSQSVLSTFLTLTTVIVAALTLGRGFLPALSSLENLDAVTSMPVYTLNFGYFTFHLTFTPGEVSGVIIANLFVFIFSMYISGISAITGIRALFDMVFWDRLSVQSGEPSLGIERQYPDWVQSNSQTIADMRQQIHAGGRYGYLSIVFFAVGGIAYLGVAELAISTLIGLDFVLVVGSVFVVLKSRLSEDEEGILPAIPDEGFFYYVTRTSIAISLAVVVWVPLAILIALALTGFA